MTDRPCNDCAVKPGELHRPGCDVERCPFCGGQLISCGCNREILQMEDDDADMNPIQSAEWERRLQERGLIPWTGTWPGVAECVEFGWYAYFDKGWHRCTDTHPEATADLNRLHVDAVWDAELKRWCLPKARTDAETCDHDVPTTRDCSICAKHQ